jgi:hypothetical protein
MPIDGAYFSLKGAAVSSAFDLDAAEPKTAGAAMIAAPVVLTFLIKFLLEFIYSLEL